MPKSLMGWVMFAGAVLAVLFVVNNVSFLQNLVSRKVS